MSAFFGIDKLMDREVRTLSGGQKQLVNLASVMALSPEVLLLDDKMRQAHVDRVGKKKCSVKLTALFNSILHDIDRMGNSCVNLVDMATSGEGIRLLLKEGDHAAEA